MEIILNIEADHLDFFKDIDDIRHSFRKFAELLPADGTLIINADTPKYEDIIRDLPCNVITYGSSDMLDYSAANITYDEKGLVEFDLIKNRKAVDHIQLSVTGDHNVSNALASIATAELLQIPMETIKKGILSFSGTDRRFEYKGTFNGVTVVDDYAHHPTEIKATLRAAKELEKHRVICVFQPHRYTRTSLLKDEFATAFTSADEIYMTDIYSSGEDPIAGIDGRTIPDAVEAATHKVVHYVPSVDDIPAVLAKIVRPNDLVITMGAGSINQYGPKLLAILEEGLQ